MTGKHWFSCKVRYQTLDESGQETKASDDYVLDAYTYTEAEASIHRLMNQVIKGQFEVVQITKTTFKDVLPDDKAESWYRVKLSFITLDEESGKEKQTPHFVLVAADNIRGAYDCVAEYMRNTGTGYVVPGITYIKIKEVFMLEKEADEHASDNLNPLSNIMAAHGIVPPNVDPETGEIID